jgi:TRAP-type C4-dicarboxylate transport system permease small subunit
VAVIRTTALDSPGEGSTDPSPLTHRKLAMSFNLFKRVCSSADTVMERTFTVLIVIGGAMITITVVLQVLLRYVFEAPLFGLEEFSRLIAVWVYFLGAIFGTKLDSHVQGDVAERFFKSDRSKAMVKTLTWALSLIVCVLFLYHATKYCVWLYDTGERTTGLWWPRITSVGSMFFGALFMTLYSIGNLYQHLQRSLNLSGTSSGGDS